MKRFVHKMDPRLTRSMPLLLTPPAPYSSPLIFRVISPRWPERRRSHTLRHFYVGGVRTKLIGADSYPNHHRSPQRLVLCGASGGSAGKVTRSSSTAELSRTGVYCSHEDLRDHGRVSRRAASCEDVYRSTHTPGWDSRFSESGVSLNDSRGTDLASLVGTEDVDGVSQYSFGSSSAFHEVTGDSELDRPDSDSLSVPSSLCGGHDPRAWDDPRCGADRSAHRKTRHDSGSRERFLAELASSGRSSPDDRREFYHSTPTKRGSPVPLSIFPGEEEDLHFPASGHAAKDSLHPDPNLSSPSYNQSRDSLRSPRSPSSPSKRKEKGGGAPTKTADDSRHRSTESIPASVDTVREALNRRRQEFFSSLQDCSRLEEQSPGESVQSWITTGHTQRRSAFTDPKTLIANNKEEEEEASQAGLLRSSSSAPRTSVRERVAAIERGPSLKIQAERDSPGDCKVLEDLGPREQNRSTSDSGEGVVRGKTGKKPSDSNEGVDKRWSGDTSHRQAGSGDTYKQAGSGSARLPQTGRSSRENGAESLAPTTVAAASVDGGRAASLSSLSSSRLAPETASSPSEERTRWSAESGGGGGEQLSPRFQKTTPLTGASAHYPNSLSADVTGKKDAENINKEGRKDTVFVNEAENRLKLLLHSVDSDTDPATQSTFVSSSGDGYRSAVSGGDGLTSTYGVSGSSSSSNLHPLPTAVVTDSDGRVTRDREPTNIAPAKSEWKTSRSAVTGYDVNIAETSDCEASTSSVINGEKSSVGSFNNRPAATDWKTSSRADTESAVTGVTSTLTDNDIVTDGESTTSVTRIGKSLDNIIDDKNTDGAATEWKTRIVGAVGLQTSSDDHCSTSRTALEDGEGYRTGALLSDSRGVNNNNNSSCSSLPQRGRKEGEWEREEVEGEPSGAAAQERSHQNAQHTLVSQVTAHPSTQSRPSQDKNKYDSPSPAPHALHSFPTSTITTTTADSGYSTTTSPTPISSHYSTPTTPPPREQQVECLSEGVNNTHISAETQARQNFLNTNPALGATENEMERGATAQRTYCVDGSEQYLSSLSPSRASSVTTREVSHHHRRHVHRTTVEKTVTTQHTVRHRDPYNDGASSSPTALREGGCVNTAGVAAGVADSSPAHRCDFVTTTDRTVSTTVREEDSEREETTDTTTTTTRGPSLASPSPSSTTTTPLRQQPLIPGGRSVGEEGSHPRPHGGSSNNSATVQVTATTKRDTVAAPGTTAAAFTHLYPQPASTRQPHNGYTEEESTLEMAGSREQMNASYSILDSLQEQLSLLSQEDVSFSSPTRSPRNCSQGWEYRDHAEATLPRTQHCYSDAEDKSDRVGGGTSSVSITLNRSYADSSGRGEQHTTQISGSTFPAVEGQSVTESKTDYLHGHAWEARRDTDLRHARVTQGLSTSWGEEALSSEDGEGGGRGREAGGDDRGTLPPSALSQRTTTSLWRRPASSSSSELDDSDGNYSSISTTESSHHQHGPHSESDFPPSETGGPEDYDNIHSFNEFVSGLKGQSTSDQPSLHHSMDMVAHDLRGSGSALLRASFVQETILEADDESETADEANTTGDTTLSSFRSSLHFSVPPPQSTPRMQYVSPVPQIRLWSTDQSVSELTASEEKRQYAVSPIHPLQDLSDRLSSISGDLSYDLSRTMHDDSRHDLDLSGYSRHSACSSPAPSDVSDGSLYSTSATAEVRKQAEQGTSFKSAEPTPTHRLTRRNLNSAFESKAASSRSKKSQWVEEKVVLFQKLLNDFEWQSKSSEQQLLDEMCAFETGRADSADVAQKSSELCDDLYRAFTREFQELRQSHVCPFVEDHLPEIRFKRFLRKKHNSKLKGNRTFRIRHRLARLAETESQGGGGKSASDLDLSQHRHAPYSPLHASKLLSPSALRERLVSDVFTEDADVKKSFSSDSAYSTLSSATSRHISDLDSTWRSVCDSRGDVSSIATDVSMDDTDKLRSLSDVFDQLDVCEGEIDQALLDRLRVGHYKADTL